MRTLSTTILALAVCFTGSASATEVYRWTDAKGVTQYADTPPANTAYERVNVRTGKTTRSDELQQQAGDAAAGDADAQPTHQAQVDAANRAQRCQAAQRNLAVLRSGMDVTAEIDGESQLLSDEQRQTRIAQNERIEAANCENPAE